jgi:serine/threonine-protein kinase
MPDESRVQLLLEEILNSSRTPEDVCAGDPELLTSVRQRLDRLRRVELQIAELFPDHDSTGQGFDTSVDSDDRFPQIDGYHIESVLGQGGIGVVFKARHLKLNRHVALKMLLTGMYASPVERARFQREALAVAALAHPNIVQVHDTGEAAGRNYFTMEVIEGGTLAQKLAGQVQPARAAARLGAILAQALQFAHQGGFIHRDLKPSNILLTRDGIPKITDFGLVRSIDAGPEFTLSGMRVGTPAYMAPEQAAGKASGIGPAVDIYSLGAILFEMLTGSPPFRGESVAEIVQKVIHEDPIAPSRSNPKVPRDLETICLKCLHKQPERRYVSAGALAEDLQRFDRGEAIGARPEGPIERLTRRMRRRPIVMVSLTASALLLVTVIVGGFWIRGERAANELSTRQLNQVNQVRRDLAFQASLDVIRLNRTANADGSSDTLANTRINKAQADRDYETAFREAGLANVLEDPEKVAARLKASNIRDSLAAALDDWAGCVDGESNRPRQDWLVQVAQRLDPDSTGLRHRLYDPAVWKNKDALTELAGRALPGKTSVQALLVLSERLREVGADAGSFLTRVQQQHPGDFWANFLLGEVLSRSKPQEAIRYYQAALAIRPGAAVVHNNLGRALAYEERMDEAIPLFQSAIALDPTLSHAYSNLGLALRAKGRKEEALEQFQLAVRFGPQHAAAHSNLGIGLIGAKRLKEAREHFREALRLDNHSAGAHSGIGYLLMLDKLVDEAIEHFREVVRLRPDFPLDLVVLGEALNTKNQIDEAGSLFRRALELDPGCVQAHCGYGYYLLRHDRLAEAIDHCEQAVRKNPKHAAGHMYLGNALENAGRPREALDHFRTAVELEPTNHQYRCALALGLASSGGEQEAIIEFEESIRLNPELIEAHTELGKALMELGRFGAARGVLERCLEHPAAAIPEHRTKLVKDIKTSLMQSITQCHRFLELELLLPTIIAGQQQLLNPDDELELAELCRRKQQYAVAMRLFARVFARNPESMKKSKKPYLYRAACAAVLASCGRDASEANLPEAERKIARGRAGVWLVTQLDQWKAHLESGDLMDRVRIRNMLARCQIENALAGVRDENELARLSEAERANWQKLWTVVQSLKNRDAGALLQQARACVDRREWAKAMNNYAELFYATVPTSEPWFEFAAVQLLAGNHAGYRQSCTQLLAEKQVRAFLAARACTLAPQSQGDVQAAADVARRELDASATAYWSLTERGGLSVRAGNAHEALALLEKSLEAQKKPGTKVLNWLWLALAHQKLGNREEAVAWLKKANDWLREVGATLPANAEQSLGLHRHNWLEAHALLNELLSKAFRFTFW